MPLTFKLLGNNYLEGPYSLLFPTTASIGTVSASGVTITGISGPPNLTFSVIRNGVTIATGQTGSSYTDTSLNSFAKYTYQIVPSNQFFVGNPVTVGKATIPALVPATVRYVFTNDYIGDGTNTWGANTWQMVTFQNLSTGKRSMVVYTSSMSSWNMTSTSTAIQSILNILPVNPTTGSRGILVGDFIHASFPTDIATALSSISSQMVVLENSITNSGTNFDNEMITVSSTGITMSFWYYSVAHASTQVLKIYKQSAGYVMFEEVGNNISVSTANNVANSSRIATITNASPGNIGWNGAWTHIGLTLTYGTAALNDATLKLYYNGVLSSTTTNCIYPVLTSSYYLEAADNQIGVPSFGTKGYYGIDDIRYYNSVLTDSQMTGVYNNTF